MFKYIIIATIAGFIYECVSWLFRIYVSSSWIREQRKTHIRVYNSTARIHILIPALIEADIIENTVSYFNNHFLQNRGDIFLIIITTEKEKLMTDLKPNTIDVAQNLVVKYRNIKHIHFPKQKGGMAHQLNYAIDILTKDKQIMSNDLIAVYNADSRPEKETFDWVRVKFQEDKYSAFQQYGYYSGNIFDISQRLFGSILISGSLWQTRWTIGFEIYNALKQLKFLQVKKILRFNYPLNYCIGHGLFITRDLYEKVGGFSENTHNEDAIMGLQLSDMQELLMPIPYFDISESPDTLKMLYKQKSNWYFGPLQAYSYMAYILKRSNYNFLEKLRLALLSTKLFLHAIFWLVGPTFMLLSIGLTIMCQDTVLLSLVLMSIILFAVPSITSYIFMLELEMILPSMSVTKTIEKLVWGFFVFYILHGASAYRGLCMYIKQIVTGKGAIKEKTIIKRF